MERFLFKPLLPIEVQLKGMSYMKKVIFKYKNKRTGEIYNNLLEAQDKLGVLGYVDVVESGDLVKVLTCPLDEITANLKKD